MKHLLLALGLIFFFQIAEAQAKRPTKSPPTPESSVKDSVLSITMTPQIDTLKVKLVTVNSEGFLEVTQGYVVRHFWLDKKTGQPMSQNPSRVAYFTDKWLAIKPDNVIEPLTRQINW